MRSPHALAGASNTQDISDALMNSQVIYTRSDCQIKGLTYHNPATPRNSNVLMSPHALTGASNTQDISDSLMDSQVFYTGDDCQRKTG